MWIVVAGAVVGMLLISIVVANLVVSERQAKYSIEHVRALGDSQIARELNIVLGRSALEGNSVDHLCNGEEIFPAMLEAIDAATTSITFETYIYWSGDIAAQFARSLGARASAGARVHVLLDWSGSIGMDDVLIQQMVQAGVEVHYYHPLRWYHLSRMNNRTHRKLLVIDGVLGFIGGVGIADQWSGNAQDPQHWRDSHFRVRGPVVAQLQAAFLDNWLKTAGRMLRGPAYFPELASAGEARAQVLASSPAGGSESMHLFYLLILSAAARTIDLSAAYFVPDRVSLQTLVEACERGVRVRILLPGRHTDEPWARHASKALWPRLLRAGAEIYEYDPTMYHCKILIVDGLAVSVGSTNFDNRSFNLNDEASLNVYQQEFARTMTTIFERDLTRAHQVTLGRWLRRPLLARATETLVLPFASQF